MTLATVMTMMTIAFAPAGTVADLTGKWAINGDVQGNPVNLDCTLAQGADAALTGRCQVNGGEIADVSGAAKDTAIQFSFTVQGYTLTYSGKVEGETVAGTIEVAGASGTFSGTRAPQMRAAGASRRCEPQMRRCADRGERGTHAMKRISLIARGMDEPRAYTRRPSIGQRPGLR